MILFIFLILHSFIYFPPPPPPPPRTTVDTLDSVPQNHLLNGNQIPDSMISLGQRWADKAEYVGPTLAYYVGPT